MNSKLILIAAAIAVSASPAAAGGLNLGILSGKNNGIANGGIVVAPSVGVGVGDVLSGNDVLNKALNGTLNNILSNNGTGIDLGILSGNGGKKRRY